VLPTLIPGPGWISGPGGRSSTKALVGTSGVGGTDLSVTLS
jgi:hypothetical protein